MCKSSEFALKWKLLFTVEMLDEQGKSKASTTADSNLPNNVMSFAVLLKSHFGMYVLL